MRKKSKINEARIQRAVVGMIIPMTSIPQVYGHAEKLIAEGADDDQLKAGIRKFIGVE